MPYIMRGKVQDVKGGQVKDLKIRREASVSRNTVFCSALFLMLKQVNIPFDQSCGAQVLYP
jgi:hypothetical protein